MAKTFQWKYFAGHVALTAIGAVGITYFGGLSIWLSVPLVSISLVLNSYLAEWEDNQPGGFNNP